MRSWRIQISTSLAFLIILPWTITISSCIRVQKWPPFPRGSARDSGQIRRIAAALTAYKHRFGEYPPDFTTGNPRREINEHLKNIFPLRDSEADLPRSLDHLGPHNALTFWLTGFYEDNPEFPLTGFIPLDKVPMTDDEVLAMTYADPYISLLVSKNTENVESTEAFQNICRQNEDLQAQQKAEHKARSTLSKALFNFSNRVAKNGEYRLSCSNAPLIYFRGDNYSNAAYQSPQWGSAYPYFANSDRSTYAAADHFQLICTGYDSQFGDRAIAADQAHIFETHADNLTNFSPLPLAHKQMEINRRRAIMTKNVSPIAALACTCILLPLALMLRKEEETGVLLRRQLRRHLQGRNSPAWDLELSTQRQRHRQRALERISRSQE